VDVLQLEGDSARATPDRLVHEEPLEIQIGGTPIAVVMRTPGHDLELVAGFLCTERVVEGLGQVASIRHCSRVSSPEAEDNVVRVLLRPGVELDLERLRRNLFASSSCGVCGKATLENAMATAAPLRDDMRLPASVLYGMPAQLRAGQPVFDETGGLHAAGLFDGAGKLRVVREDVGRHNAVDKVVGWAARGTAAGAGLELAGQVLVVSGRVSFEIVQKALAARIPIVAGVSAPSSLAVSLAAAAGMTVVGFLRGQGGNIYSGRERVLTAPG
jgi:FdhD protein